MNIQKLIDQTRDMYDNHEHSTTVMNALDYLEQLAKKEDEKRIKLDLEQEHMTTME